MAKTLLVKAGVVDGGDKTSYTYPPEYDAKKIQVLCYEKGEERKTRDDGKQYLIGVVKDVDAVAFLASKDITELNDANAKEKGGRWRPQVEKIGNQDKLLKILAKQARNETLTEEEEDGLDPNKGGAITKSQHFDDLLEDKKRWANK